LWQLNKIAYLYLIRTIIHFFICDVCGEFGLTDVHLFDVLPAISSGIFCCLEHGSPVFGSGLCRWLARCSQTGKRLMAKCRMLLQENEDLGRSMSSGRIAKLEGDIALQKRLIDEMKNSEKGQSVGRSMLVLFRCRCGLFRLVVVKGFCGSFGFCERCPWGRRTRKGPPRFLTEGPMSTTKIRVCLCLVV